MKFRVFADFETEMSAAEHAAETGYKPDDLVDVVEETLREYLYAKLPAGFEFVECPASQMIHNPLKPAPQTNAPRREWVGAKDREMINKEKIYDEQIAGLMTQMIEICQKNEIEMVASFHIPSPEDEGLCCTTYLRNNDGLPHFRQAAHTLRYGLPSAMAVTIAPERTER